MAAKIKVRFTQGFVNRLVRFSDHRKDYIPKKGGIQYVWDAERRGFGLRFWPSGVFSYVAWYRVRDGRQRNPRFKVLGDPAEMTLEEAREEAAKLRAAARQGEDVVAKRGHTVAALATRYLETHAAKKMKAGREADERNLRKHVVPRLGEHQVDQITRPDIVELHQSLTEGVGPVLADRVLALLSKAFALAELWGWRPEHTNPCRGVPRNGSTAEQRALSREELRHFWRALDEIDREGPGHAVSTAALRIMILTGCRPGQLVKVRRDTYQVWKTPLSGELVRVGRFSVGERGGTHKGRSQEVLLPPRAVAIIEAMQPVPGNPYLFPGKTPGGHLTTVRRVFQRAARLAKVKNVHPHSLRHTFVTHATRVLAIHDVKDLVQHKDIRTTDGYRHSDQDALAEAAISVERHFDEMLSGDSSDVN